MLSPDPFSSLSLGLHHLALGETEQSQLNPASTATKWRPGTPTYLRLLWQPKGSPHHAEGRGLESEVWEVALDHSDCLCRGFLPHLRSGLLAAQAGRCPAGEWSGCRRMLPRGRTGKRASREVPLQIQPIIPGGFGGPCGMWSTEIEKLSSKSKPVIHLSGQSLPVTDFPRPLHGKGFTLEAISLGVVFQHLPAASLPAH